VLLVMLSETSEIREAVRLRLPGDKLTPLVDAVIQFLKMHQKVDDEMQEAHNDGLAQRMQAAIKRLGGTWN
jgi:hypothetical protein